MISDETYEEVIRRPWFVPGAHERPAIHGNVVSGSQGGIVTGERCDQCAGQCDAGKRCPRTFATTEPGELAPPREDRNIAGTGLVISLALVFGGVCLGSALALAFNGWPK